MPRAQPRLERRVVEDRQAEARHELWIGHLMNYSRVAAQVEHRPGTTPSTQRSTATPDGDHEPSSACSGIVTLGPSPTGSAKNISTITRT